MASECAICFKKSQVGGGYSNRVRATKYNPTGKRRRHVNLQWARLSSGDRVKACTKCIKGNKHLTAKI